MNILDGKALASKILNEVREESDSLMCRPGLAVILVGNNQASKTYVNGKRKDCDLCNIYHEQYNLPGDTPEEELLYLIDRLNCSVTIDGILVQLPLPSHIDTYKVLSRIYTEKDVDGFNPINVGKLSIANNGFVPCTPAGIITLLDEYNIPIEGKHAVVINRSNIVGKPLANLLLQRNATVTVCHSKTINLSKICRQADILVTAVGKPNFITTDMIKPGAVIIDVSINKNENGKLCGDVCFDEVSKLDGWITPVPGGIGPMTRAMLMKNTLKATKLRIYKH